MSVQIHAQAALFTKNSDQLPLNRKLGAPAAGLDAITTAEN